MLSRSNHTGEGFRGLTAHVWTSDFVVYEVYRLLVMESIFTIRRGKRLSLGVLVSRFHHPLLAPALFPLTGFGHMPLA